MNLLLNASNLRHGGGKTVALQLIKGLASLRNGDLIYVLAPRMPEYEALASLPGVSLIPLPDHFHQSWLSKLWYMYRVFPRWCRRYAIDKVVSLGNAAFPCGKRPQLVYIQLPQLVYHESPAWKKMEMGAFLRNSLMDQYVAMHLRFATSYAVQTPVMKQRLMSRFRMEDERIHILPNAPLESDTHPTPLPQPGLPLKLLFLSRYYPHKNFEVLPRLAELIEERGLPVEITLTISSREASGAAKVLQELKGKNCIRNIGPVPLTEVAHAVQACHGVFLPSLMESFSGVYAEALMHRRHVFTSHYDFATELLGEAAFYFDPLRPEHIAGVLEEVTKNPSLLTQKLRPLEYAAQKAPRLEDISRSFSRIIDTFV